MDNYYYVGCVDVVRQCVYKKHNNNSQDIRDICFEDLPRDHVALVPFDLTAPEADLLAAARRAESAFGRIDVLVHNAGMSQHSVAEVTPASALHTMLQLNLVAPLTLTHAVLTGMLQRWVVHMSLRYMYDNLFVTNTTTAPITANGVNSSSSPA